MALRSVPKSLWDFLAGLPFMMSSILFYLVICFFLGAFLCMINRILYKPLKWTYCLAVTITLGNINAFLFQRTAKRLFYRIDDKLYDHIFKTEEKTRDRSKESVRNGDKICLITGVLLFLAITMGVLLTANKAENQFPRIVNAPAAFYQRIETAKCIEDGVLCRDERIAAKEILPKRGLIREAAVYYELNDEGWHGSNIRDKPQKDNSTVLTTVAENAILEGLNEESTDQRGIIWLKVRTQSGVEGWISKKLVEEMENQPVKPTF